MNASKAQIYFEYFYWFITSSIFFCLPPKYASDFFSNDYSTVALEKLISKSRFRFDIDANGCHTKKRGKKNGLRCSSFCINALKFALNWNFICINLKLELHSSHFCVYWSSWSICTYNVRLANFYANLKYLNVQRDEWQNTHTRAFWIIKSKCVIDLVSFRIMQIFG